MSIKSNEYRLGNLLRDKVSGEWMRVISLTEEGGMSFYVLNRDKFPLSVGWQAEPIPLSPEILEACGFVMKGEYAVGAGSYRTYNHPTGFSLYADVPVESPIRHSSCKMAISYVHQLQNLFYSLTGTELHIHL